MHFISRCFNNWNAGCLRGSSTLDQNFAYIDLFKGGASLPNWFQESVKDSCKSLFYFHVSNSTCLIQFGKVRNLISIGVEGTVVDKDRIVFRLTWYICSYSVGVGKHTSYFCLNGANVVG